MSSDTAVSKDSTPPPVPEGVREFLAFFRTELGAVAFPDLDAHRVEASEDVVRLAQERLDAARAEVGEAQRALTQAVSQLTDDARRGLAYARVYAEGKPDLQDRLAKLKLGKRSSARKAAPPRPRGALRVAGTVNGPA